MKVKDLIEKLDAAYPVTFKKAEVILCEVYTHNTAWKHFEHEEIESIGIEPESELVINLK